ncbi:MAG: hypothetical protein GWM87_02795 [Xanthomonadales bacterium]|nr:hypothetical protein [Xanthomonadales bacterium]NIX11978.1 hypothetical protein [Xanthomonadales bacterium]
MLDSVRMPAICRVAIFALLALPLASALAGPLGFSVNSDEPNGDSLHLIDLESGIEQEIGSVKDGQDLVRTDVEGLAIDPDGLLWGVDDDSHSLFPINSISGLVQEEDEVDLSGFEEVWGNDFGLTFTCSGDLYVSSLDTQSLYVVDTETGFAQLKGNMGANISAIAAWGNPARIFGLSNGMRMVAEDVWVPDDRSLYEINPESGEASLVGELGGAASQYFEAGLAFDESGVLWAITDRRTFEQDLGSEILRLDLEADSDLATLVSTTTAVGFESLAISAPGGCQQAVDPEERYPQIPVLDRFGLLMASLLLLLTGITALHRARP